MLELALVVTALVQPAAAGMAVAESAKRTFTFGLSEPADAAGTMTVAW